MRAHIVKVIYRTPLNQDYMDTLVVNAANSADAMKAGQRWAEQYSNLPVKYCRVFPIDDGAVEMITSERR